MALVSVRFACGHLTEVGDNPSGAPVCHCGETKIARVQARAPRFSGACTGPYAELKNVSAAVVNVAPSGPLKLKEQES